MEGWKDNVQYKFAPEMAEYRRFAAQIEWRPYLMTWHPADYRSAVINTDKHGFRVSCDAKGRPFSIDDVAQEKCCVVVGNSTAMGASASSDATHLASQLARIDGKVWVNFGGRAFTSTQEAIHFLYNRHRFKSIETVVIFSGIIDLYCGFAFDEFDPDFGSLFQAPEFDTVMNGPRRLTGKRAAMEVLLSPVYGDRIDYANIPLSALAKELVAARRREAPRNRVTRLHDDSAAGHKRAFPSRRAKRDRILQTLARNLDIWSDVARAGNTQVIFALQPLPPWTGKIYSVEEREIFDYFDKRDSEWHECLKLALDAESHGWFAEGARRLSEERGLKFIDLNRSWRSRRTDGEWLFVDMCHLNDAGFALSAECLNKEVLTC